MTTETYLHPDASLSLTIVASNRQKGNPILPHLKGIRLTFADIVPDYLLSQTSAVLFISLKYHRLHPSYLQSRITSLKRQYRLRLLLCLVDLPDLEGPLEHVTQLAFQGNMSLFLAWSSIEAGRILQTFKAIGDKPPDIIQSRLDSDLNQRIIDVLTTTPTINKTDGVTLMREFGSLKKLMMASKDEVVRCAGIGDRKLKQFWKVFHEPLGKEDRAE